MRSTTYSDWSFGLKQFLLLIGISPLITVTLPVSAQTRITGDATLPTPTKINNLKSGIYEITGGSRPENAVNLFHSLQEFSIQSGDTARFTHDAAIKNILTRVTGGSASNINGTIQTWIDGVKPSTANLFLINPQGIIFGQDAILNIGGSFIGSTAQTIKFADGAEFSAINPSSQSLLTISVPIGLQLGSQPNSSININGSGNNLKVSPADFSIDRSNRPSGLNYQNSSNQILALIGNEIILDGGNITFPAGQIELWSVNQGEITLVNKNSNLELKATQGIEYGNINLFNAASIDTSGTSGGSIQIKGKNISLQDASVIISDTLGSGSGGEINIFASESIAVKGFALQPNNQVFSSILADVATGASGNGGKINLETKILQVEDGGQISSGTFGSGNAGELNVKAKDIQMSGFSPFGPSAIATPVAPGATGNGGTLTIKTDSLQLTNAAQIFSSTFGFGKAGDLKIKAENIELNGGIPQGPSSIVTAVQKIPGAPDFLGTGKGTGGDLNIETGSLRVINGAQISSSTSGSGTAGNLQIKADSVELTGSNEFGRSGLLANAVVSNGEGGDLDLTTDKLIIRDRAAINASNFLSSDPENLRGLAGSGTAGNINVNSPFILLENQGTITASTNAGDKGNINIESENLQLFQESNITSNARNSSNGGNIFIDTDTLVGFQNSDITANATEGFGGQVTINAQGIFGIAQRFQLTPGSDITASSNRGAEFNGVVELNTPDIDPNSGVNNLPATVVDADNYVSAGCAAQQGNNFLISNRGGLPHNPTTILRGANLWLDLRTASKKGEKVSSSDVRNSKPAIVEATGWVRGKDGELYLVANNQMGGGVDNQSAYQALSCRGV
ncbi:filamentous hemagglutinin family N-terminal domain protein [Rivularia sp. PCC 7116]|uniref:two-partner secretion domain-containing protein n=1 Tax=Rivularia sp. PCC 7116 TaxID=373994 RepID=UPI00029F3420|nr:filamentous hemagglutinin N-terminal domain-containing protein [Rivularia sp. PCC 7116]AFY58328.1 filamentous hemagglutinin family N-terminal domain protein [Rivularia sp. PCC 7116]